MGNMRCSALGAIVYGAHLLLLSFPATGCSSCRHTQGLSDASVPDSLETGPGTLTQGSAAVEGQLAVSITDYVTGAPLNTATLTIGTVQTPITSDEALVAAPTGRQMVTVAAPNYMPWAREIAVGSRPRSLNVRLLSQPASFAIGSAGYSLSTSGWLITVPPGAVPDNTQFSTLWLDNHDVARLLPIAQFSSADQRVHRMVGAYVASLSVTAAAPITVTLPLPPYGTGAGVTVWQLASDGTWINPTAPTSFDAGSATFTHTASGTFGVSIDTNLVASARVQLTAVEEAGEVVTEASPGTTALEPTPSGTQTVTVTEGDKIPQGSTLSTANGEATVVDQLGNAGNLGAQSSATLTTCVDATLCTAGATEIDIVKGRWLEVINSPPRSLRLRTTSMSLGDRGTVFQVDESKCANSARVIDDVEVYEGAVDVDPTPPALATVSVTAGQSEDVCSTCAANEVPSCNCLAWDPEYFYGNQVGLTVTGTLPISTDAGVYEACTTFGPAGGTKGPRALTADGAQSLFAGDPGVLWFDSTTCTGFWIAVEGLPSSQYTYETTYRLVHTPDAGSERQMTTVVTSAQSSGRCTVVQGQLGQQQNPYPDAAVGHIDAF